MSGDVDVFALDVDAIAPDDWGALEALLDDDERARAARFHFDADRRSYVGAHALLRAMLSRRAGAKPQDWRFAAGEHGKPYLFGAPCDLRFNLSHTRGAAAVAVAEGIEVGVDAERGDRPHDIKVAERFFAREEITLLRAAEADASATTFFSIWTLKEAVIKAMGLGLAFPLDSFAVSLAPPRVTMREKNAPQDWRVALWAQGSVHIAAATPCREARFQLVEIDVAALLRRRATRCGRVGSFDHM